MALVHLGATLNRSGKRYRLEAEYNRFIPTRGMLKGHFSYTTYVANTDSAWLYDEFNYEMTQTRRKEIGSWIRQNADYKILYDGTRVDLK